MKQDQLILLGVGGVAAAFAAGYFAGVIRERMTTSDYRKIEEVALAARTTSLNNKLDANATQQAIYDAAKAKDKELSASEPVLRAFLLINHKPQLDSYRPAPTTSIHGDRILARFNKITP